MKINPKQIEAVLALPGPKRYRHFIKVAADQRIVWGLCLEGWALARTDDDRQVFPLWPTREYAERCATGTWSGFQPREIDLDTLFENLLPNLVETGTMIGVFPTPSDKGITPELKQFVNDIREELAKIE